MDTDTNLVEGLLNAYRILQENSVKPPDGENWTVILNQYWRHWYWMKVRHGRRFMGRYLRRWKRDKTDDEFFMEEAWEDWLGE